MSILHINIYSHSAAEGLPNTPPWEDLGVVVPLSPWEDSFASCVYLCANSVSIFDRVYFVCLLLPQIDVSVSISASVSI